MPAPINHFTVPEGAWDAHMHVTDINRFPPPSTQASTYSATNHTLADASRHASALSLPNLVFIQPSTYGTDNSCVLWCLKQRAANTARGVVVIDPRTIDTKTLLNWHEAGVRGVRVNLRAVDANPSHNELDAIVKSLDSVLSDLPSWGIHFYVDLAKIPALAATLASLGSTRKICIDHMASPTAGLIRGDDPSPADVDAWNTFRRVLERPNVFVKISAPYRFVRSSGPPSSSSLESSWAGLEDLVRSLLVIRNGDAVVFASDWPHTRFEGVDVTAWRELCLQWCGKDVGLREKLFVRNAERLYDVNQ